MIKVIKMEVDHMHEVLADQPELSKYIIEEQIFALVSMQYAYTAVNAYGKVLGCAGLVEKWGGRAEAWAILDQNSKEYFLQIHHAVKRFLKSSGIRRIEAEVNCRFPEGHRWVKSLGFKLEAPMMRFFDPAGNDCSLYSFITEEA